MRDAHGMEGYRVVPNLQDGRRLKGGHILKLSLKGTFQDLFGFINILRPNNP